MDIKENRKLWEESYNWRKKGDEWSEAWGDTPYLWYGTLLPRILKFVPARHILEIAPGFGRCTKYLKNLCKELTIVDLSEKCINACKERFKENLNISYFVNDGKSLSMISDNSVDFIFSWDSLVHVEADVIKSYLEEFSRILKSGGIGFIHHSNLKDCSLKENMSDSFRAKSMSARLFEEYCSNVGLQCVVQEIVSWGDSPFLDCISVFTLNDKTKFKNKMIRNADFMNEAGNSKKISSLYSV